MTSIVNTMNGIEDPDRIERMEKMSTHITKMPIDIKDRFKALKTISDECYDIEEEEETEIRNIEVMFEALYSDLYRQRFEVVNNMEMLPISLV